MGIVFLAAAVLGTFINAASPAMIEDAIAAASAVLSRQAAGDPCPPGEFVLVDGHARMLTAPEAAAEGFGLSDGEAWDGKKSYSRAGVAFRYVGHAGDWFEVETTGELPDACLCQRPLPSLKDFRLRLFVTREAVHQVLTRPVEATSEAGLRIWLQPGTEVSGNGDALRFGRLPSPFHVAVPGDAVGMTFPLSQLPALAVAAEPPPYKRCQDGKLHRTFIADEDCGGGELVLAVRVIDRDETRALRGAAVHRRGCILFEKDYPIADGDRPERSMSVLAVVSDSPTVEGGSLTGEVALQSPFLEPSPFGTQEEGDRAEKETIRYSAREGAQAWWPNGRPAGVVLVRHLFAGEPVVRGERRCLTEPTDCLVGNLGLAGGDDCDDPARHEHLTLCFAPEDLLQQKPSP